MTKRRRLLGRLIVLNVVLLMLSIAWYGSGSRQIQLAVAKSGQSFYAYTLPKTAVNPTYARNILLADPGMRAAISSQDVEFVNAVPLSVGEARAWADLGCTPDNCIQATLYNHTSGGTIEAIVQQETAEVLASWSDPYGRPAGTPIIAERALDIAAADPDVQALLGDIKNEAQVMVPMSGWLVDDACRTEWCVDLTYNDPVGSGRIVHVFVNMEQDSLARIFYTRGRASQANTAVPPMQRYAYSDGCNEQYGWNVCWEMTAHDGVLFRDGVFDGRTIFSSIKITQVEAWYPSWPGGYRDEIGFSASVPPFGDTQITDFGNGFEVRQLFTEFTHWPNCICCYRYEEVLRFYDDGSFEPRFVSHGPGCDDLSIYRPFWRIDMDIDGPEGDTISLWQDGQWQEPPTEFELYPVVDDTAPDGTRLAVQDGDLLYTFQMFLTDPLGLDEARLFALQKKDEEGVGPVTTGPGDTFQPPRQWLDGDPLPNQDVVVWFVPLLKTRKTDPLWCSPDPEPGINQCEGILRIAPAQELRVPTLAELEIARATPEATATPAITPTPAPTPTPRPVTGEDAAELILNSGCGACHTIGALGEAHKVGPDLTHIADVAGDRVPGLSAAEYIRQSIMEPNAVIAPQCPNGDCLANVMPKDYAERLTPEQIDAIVNYLLFEVKDAPQVIGSDAVASPKAVPAAKSAVPSPGESSAPAIAIQLLLVTLVLLLTLFRLAKEKGG
ncbi:MAG: cytochrome c [Ardenticatenaceae bacterium]|nr:cytochrome c [Anaerolineales bacterium]MCB8922535.1 cytochrome c [Ardenticatenaceae bacterium]